MISQIYKQLKQFMRISQRGVRPPITVSLHREHATEISVGSVNSGVANVVAQTSYVAASGRTRHVFMLDVDGLDSPETELG